MAKKKKVLPLLEGVKIEAFAGEGKALAHVEGQVLFVPFACPGDICDIQVIKKKKNFLEGKIVRLVQPSENRIPPQCTHFTQCGGCKWQHVPYPIQLRYKEQSVYDAVTRLGKVNIKHYLPIIAASQTERYRNKLEFTFSHRRWLQPREMNTISVEEVENNTNLSGLGFHIPGMFDKVLDINVCHLGSNLLDRIRLFIRDFCLQHPSDYPFFNLRSQEGLMRTLMMRHTSIGEVMVVIVFYENRPIVRQKLLKTIEEAFPEINSLLYVINSKANDNIADQDIILHSGRPYVEEEMEGLRFRISPKSFYQTNSQQAYELYKVARSFANLQGNEIVYDLYTGTGTIANFIASKAKFVIGIEYIPEAIEDAKLNSQINKIENTLFYAGDMKDILTEDFISRHGRPDVIITDPPRAGMHPNVIETILKAQAQKIVYVSCNPATQARDLSLFIASGDYIATQSQAVDMFPHTHHIENVVLLERVSSK